MKLLIRDEDVVSMVLEFLHSRKFYESAVALEKETGVLRAADKHLPDHLQYLRSLCLNGEWDNVLFFLEPFAELEELDTNRLNYLVLKQKITEIMHHCSVKKAFSAKEEEMLKKLYRDIKVHCTKEELPGIIEHCQWFAYESGSLAAFRLHCYEGLVEILAPFVEVYTSTGTCPWVYQKDESIHTRLDSVVADSLYLNECRQYCKDRALKPDFDHSDLPTLSTKILENRGNDVSSRASVLFWIRSLNHAQLFRQQFDIEDVTFKTEPIVIQKLPYDPNDSPRKFSSFASPTKAEQPMFSEPAQPAVASSLQLQSTTRKPEANQLAVSSPASYPQYSTRNFSNNNNNNDAVNEGEKSPLSPRTLPNTQNGVSEKTTPKQVVDGESPLDSENSPRPSSKHSGHKHGHNPFANISMEKILNDHSDMPSGSSEASKKVEDSYEKFLLEKKKQQTETETFLKNLEEKEKRKQEIRKLLLQQPAESTDQFSPPEFKVTDNLPANRSTDQSKPNCATGTPAPWSKSKYACIEYTEDVQAIRAVAFHPSGQVYAIGSNSKLLRICKVPREVTVNQEDDKGDSLVNIQDLSPKVSEVVAKKTNLHKGSVYCAAWNDDGSLIATGSNDKVIKLLGFDILVKTLQETPAQMFWHRGIVRDVMFMHESNSLLASAGAEGMVCVSDCKYNKLVHNLAGHTDQVLGLYSWHRGLLASASQDKCVRLWDVRTPSCVSIIGVGGQEPCFPTSLCVDNSGRWMAMGLNNAKVAIYDLSAGKMACDYKCHTDEVRCLQFNPVQENILLSSSYDGKVVIADVDQILREANPKSHQQHWKRVAEATNKIIQCKWHQNGDAFAITSVNQICSLWSRLYS